MVSREAAERNEFAAGELESAAKRIEREAKRYEEDACSKGQCGKNTYELFSICDALRRVAMRIRARARKLRSE